jgi:hypothetical protein
LRCLYIEDDSKFIFLAEIKNVGKPKNADILIKLKTELMPLAVETGSE